MYPCYFPTLSEDHWLTKSVCSLILLLCWLCPICPFTSILHLIFGVEGEPYLPHQCAPLPPDFKLGLSNGRHQQKSRGWENNIGVLISLTPTSPDYPWDHGGLAVSYCWRPPPSRGWGVHFLMIRADLLGFLQI